MTTNIRKTGRLVFAACSAAYILVFLLFYFPRHVFPELQFELSSGGASAYVIVTEAISLIVDIIYPIICGATLFLCLPSLKGALLGGITFAVPQLFYSLPYCYLYALSLGYDSVEGTMISFGLSALGAIISWVHIEALYFICVWISRHSANDILKEREPGLYRTAKNPDRKANIENKIRELIFSDIKESKFFDLDSPVIWAVMVMSFAEFAVRVVIELIDTISFLVGVQGLFSEGEIISIVGAYLFLLLILVGAYAACYGIKKHLNRELEAVALEEGE